MKKYLALILVAGVFLLPGSARADEYTVIPTGSTNATSLFTDTNGTVLGSSIDISGFQKVVVQATCTSGCPAVVSIAVKVKAISSDNFVTVCTITNPDTATAQCIGPGAGYLDVVSTGYVSGAYKVTVKTIK